MLETIDAASGAGDDGERGSLCPKARIKSERLPDEECFEALCGSVCHAGRFARGPTLPDREHGFRGGQSLPRLVATIQPGARACRHLSAAGVLPVRLSAVCERRVARIWYSLFPLRLRDRPVRLYRGLLLPWRSDARRRRAHRLTRLHNERQPPARR